MSVVASDLLYRIDAQDRLCHVGTGWDAFAHANAGQGVESWQVLGRPLWAFVTDPGLAALYRMLVVAARQGRASRLRFRCDAPAERRLLEMTISGAGGGVVQFRTHLLTRAPRPGEVLLDARVTRRGRPLHVCSWCNRVLAGEEWVEAEEAVDRLHLMLRGSALPPLAHAACEACGRAVRGAMDRFARGCDPNAVLFSLGDDPTVLGAA